jgi:hypothetical protein
MCSGAALIKIHLAQRITENLHELIDTECRAEKTPDVLPAVASAT